MNVISVYEPTERVEALSTAARAPARSLAASVFALRRSGVRPISSSGRQLGHHNDYRVVPALWHELNLCQTEEGRYGAEIRVFTKAQDTQDRFHVAVLDRLEEALQSVEGYDARADMPAELSTDDEALSPAELLVQAVTPKARVADAGSQYRAALSAVLAELNRG